MIWGIVIATFAVCVQYDVTYAQQIPPTTTAAELWNPYTWLYPYAIAAAEGYRDYYVKAQKATNDLYQQVYATNAFPWITGTWGIVPPKPGQEQNKVTTGQSTTKPEVTTQKPNETSEKPKSEETTGANQSQTTKSDVNANVDVNAEDAKTTQTS